MSEVAPLFTGTDLRVTRGDKTVVRGVTLHAAKGEVLGVLGPSGAGKSTLFAALVGELPADTGRVELAGTDISSWPLWRRARAGLGYLPQAPSILWDLTVEENLRLYGRVVARRLWLRPLPGEDETIEALAERVTMTDKLRVRAGDLSGGERRRLELARALSIGPKVLVCDEPFSGVDPRQAGLLGNLLRELSESGVAVILSDHHVAEALRICTRALLLLDGEVAVEDAPDSFGRHPLVVGRYLGGASRSIPPPP